jgi:hypothetical protein
MMKAKVSGGEAAIGQSDSLLIFGGGGRTKIDGGDERPIL